MLAVRLNRPAAPTPNDDGGNGPRSAFTYSFLCAEVHGPLLPPRPPGHTASRAGSLGEQPRAQALDDDLEPELIRRVEVGFEAVRQAAVEAGEGFRA